MEAQQCNHKLEAGDKIIVDDDAELGGITSKWRVTSLEDDGAINVRRIDGDRSSQNERDTWSHESVVAGLQYGEMHDADGNSHELVKNY